MKSKAKKARTYSQWYAGVILIPSLIEIAIAIVFFGTIAIVTVNQIHAGLDTLKAGLVINQTEGK